MILNATEAVYQWLLFLRGKNGGKLFAIAANFGKVVRIRGFSPEKNTKQRKSLFTLHSFPAQLALMSYKHILWKL